MVPRDRPETGTERRHDSAHQGFRNTL